MQATKARGHTKAGIRHWFIALAPNIKLRIET